MSVEQSQIARMDRDSLVVARLVPERSNRGNFIIFGQSEDGQLFQQIGSASLLIDAKATRTSNRSSLVHNPRSLRGADDDRAVRYLTTWIRAGRRFPKGEVLSERKSYAVGPYIDVVELNGDLLVLEETFGVYGKIEGQFPPVGFVLQNMRRVIVDGQELDREEILKVYLDLVNNFKQLNREVTRLSIPARITKN